MTTFGKKNHQFSSNEFSCFLNIQTVLENIRTILSKHQDNLSTTTFDFSQQRANFIKILNHEPRLLALLIKTSNDLGFNINALKNESSIQQRGIEPKF